MYIINLEEKIHNSILKLKAVLIMVLNITSFA